MTLQDKTPPDLTADVESLRHRIAELEVENSRLQQELYLNETIRRLVHESLHEGIWVIDHDFFTTFVNPRMAAMLGYTVEEMVGRQIFSFMDERGVDICKQNFERRQKGIKEKHDFEFLRKDGSRMYARLETTPMKTEHDLGVMAGVIDVTEREQVLRENVEQYQAITSSTMDGFWMLDADGHTLDVNETYSRMIGYSRDELLRMTVADVEALESPELISEHIRQLVEQGTSRFESVHRCKDGHLIDVEVRAIFLPQQKRVIGFVRDITERKRTEEMLRESEEKYRLLVESAPIGIFRTVSQGKRQALSVNSAMAHILGYESAEDAIHHITDLGAQLYVRTERRQEFLQLLREHGYVENFEYEAYAADGRQVWLSMNARVADIDEDGTFIIEGFTADITARKQAEKYLQEKVDELDRFNRLMVGRELRMIELKREINQLCDQMGKPPRYAIATAGIE